jgi:hypothetical protein
VDIINATFPTASAYVEYLLGKRDISTGLLAYGLGDWIPVVPSPMGVTATGILVQVIIDAEIRRATFLFCR